VVRMPECKWCAGLAIVEDEKDLVRMYIRLFEKKGIPVCFVAHDGSEAILRFVQCTPKPHIILMDYRLPIMNGVEVTKKILEIDPETKIIFLSADINVKEEALNSGAYTFLKKPVPLKVITDTIDKIMTTSPTTKF